MVTIGATVSPSGIRVVGPGGAFRVCWAVESTYATPDQGERVAYVVTHPTGGTVLSGDATTYEVKQPNFSAVQSRMPNAPTGQAPIRCYSLDLPLDSLPRGLLTIAATAHGHDGTSVVLETIVVANDEAVVMDSRASTAVVYMDYDVGNDANTGASWGQAVKTLDRAIDLCVVGGNAGGATVNVRGNLIGGGARGGRPGQAAWQTGEMWLHFVADGTVTWRANNPPTTNLSTYSGGDALATNGPSAGSKIKLRFTGFQVMGGGLTCYDTSGHQGTDVQVWFEGGSWGSINWDNNGPRVRCLEDIGSSAGGPMNIEGIPGRKGKYYLTGMLLRGGGVAVTAHDLIFDCEILDHLGGTTYAAGWPTAKAVFHSLVAHRHNYSRNVTRGWGCNRQGELIDLQPLESQDMGGGVMRILGPVGGYRFDLALADNIGSTRTRLGIRAWPDVGTDPTGRVIVGTGITGGRPYVDIQHTAAVYGAAPAGAEIETVAEWRPGVGDWAWFNDRIHPSSLSRPAGANRDTVIFRDIVVYDSTQEVQSHFSNLTAPIDNLLIDNVRDAGTGANWVMGFISAPPVAYRNCIFRRITAAASGVSLSSGPSYAGSQMTNCVFRTVGAEMAGAISGGLQVNHCHWIDDNSGQPWHGTSATYGAFLSSAGTSAPWQRPPILAQQGNGDPRVPEPAPLNWTASGSTRGALRNVALLDWSMPVGGVVMDGGGMAGASTAAPTVQHFTAGALLAGQVDDEEPGAPGAYEPAVYGGRWIDVDLFGPIGDLMQGLPIAATTTGTVSTDLFTAGGLMDGGAIAAASSSAVAGDVYAQVVMDGGTIDEVAVVNPAGGIIEVGSVHMDGAGIDAVDVAGIDGDLFAHVHMDGAAIAATTTNAVVGEHRTGVVMAGTAIGLATAGLLVVDEFGAEPAMEPEPEEPARPQPAQRPRPWTPPPLSARPRRWI